MKRLLLAFGLLLGFAIAADPIRPKNLGEIPRLYLAECASTTVCTIQQQASGSNKVRIIWAEVSCASACTISQARNGTAATGTPVTVRSVNPDRTDVATATVWKDSNVGSGTPLRPAASVLAGITHMDLDGLFLIGDGATKNYTITTSGSATITLKWEEYN